MGLKGSVRVAVAGYRESRRDLSQRLSQTIYATKFNKMLLVWSLQAPTQSELEQLPTGSIVLEGVPPIQLKQSLRAKNQP